MGLSVQIWSICLKFQKKTKKYYNFGTIKTHKNLWNIKKPNTQQTHIKEQEPYVYVNKIQSFCLHERQRPSKRKAKFLFTWT